MKNSCKLKVIKSIQELDEHMRTKPIGVNILKDNWLPVKVKKGHAMICEAIKHDMPDYSISVSDNFAIAGTTYPQHDHRGWESFVIYQGSMKLFIENGEPTPILLNKIGRPYYFDATNVHWAEFEEFTRFIATTIPFEPDWS